MKPSTLIAWENGPTGGVSSGEVIATLLMEDSFGYRVRWFLARAASEHPSSRASSLARRSRRWGRRPAEVVRTMIGACPSKVCGTLVSIHRRQVFGKGPGGLHQSPRRTRAETIFPTCLGGKGA